MMQNYPRHVVKTILQKVDFILLLSGDTFLIIIGRITGIPGKFMAKST